MIRALISAKLNAFSLSLAEQGRVVLSDGIVPSNATSLGAAVVLGKQPGWERFVRVSETDPTRVEDGMIANAITRSFESSGGTVKVLARRPEGDLVALVRVDTGHSSVVALKEKPIHYCSGPDRALVDSGHCVSRTGETVSRAYLYELRPGDCLEVAFIDRSIFSVRLIGDSLEIEDTGRRSGRDFGSSVAQAFAVSGDGAELPNRRDGARHALMRAAASDRELWDMVGTHLREHQADLRPNVLRAMAELSINPDDRLWARELLEVGKKPPVTETVIDLAAARQQRQEADRRKAMRRLRDAALRAEMKGSSGGQPRQKKASKKK